MGTSKAHCANRVYTPIEMKLSEAFERLKDQGLIEPIGPLTDFPKEK